MASKAKLQGSFGSLIDTLTQRFDPFQPEEIVVRWTGLLLRCASIARQTSAWDDLPSDDDLYDAVISALDRATRALVLADYADPDSVIAALGLTDAALDRLEDLLGTA